MIFKLIPTAVIVAIALLVLGCGPEPRISERVAMPTGNPDLRGQLLSELDRRGIWYNELNESQIEIERENTGVVGELFDDMIENVLPKDRSFSPAPEVLSALIEALDNEGVVCDSVRVFEMVWLVCDKDDMPFVDETLTRIVTESFDTDSG